MTNATIDEPKPKALKPGQKQKAKRKVAPPSLTDADRESALDLVRHHCPALVVDCRLLTLIKAEELAAKTLFRQRVGAFQVDNAPGEPRLSSNHLGVVVEHQGRRGLINWLEIAAEFMDAEDSELGDISSPAEIVRIGELPAGLNGEAAVHLTGQGSSWQFVAHARLGQVHLCFPHDHAHYRTRNHALRAGLWELAEQLRNRNAPAAQPIVKAAEILVNTMWLPGERGAQPATPPEASTAASDDAAAAATGGANRPAPTPEKSHRRGRGGTQRKASKKAKAAGQKGSGARGQHQEDRSADDADFADEKVLPQRTRSTPVPSAKSAPSADKKRSSPKRTATPDPRVNAHGVFKKFARVQVPFPKSHQCKAAVLLAESSAGRWYFGVDCRIGPNHARGSHPSLNRKGHGTRAEALLAGLAALAQIALRHDDGKHTRWFLARLKIFQMRRLDELRKPQASAPSAGSVAKESLTPKPKGAKMQKKKSTTSQPALGQVLAPAPKQKPAKKKAKKKAAGKKGSGAGGQGPVKKDAKMQVSVHVTDYGDQAFGADAPVETFNVTPAGTVAAGALVGKVIETETGVYARVRQVTLV